MGEQLSKVLDEHKDEYLGYLKDLLRIDTEDIGHGIEGGRELKGQIYLENLLKSMGAEVKKEEVKEETIMHGVDKYCEGNLGHNYEERYNLITQFKGDSKGKSILFDGHVDTMPPGDLNLWHTNPFEPVVKDGKLYGLGSSDMKAGLMASIMAVKLLKDAGIGLPGDVKILSVIDEEGGGNGTLSAVLNGNKADAAVICETSEHELITAHMGFIFFKVKVKGKALHSGSKWNGVNAIEKAIILIQALQDMEHKWLMKYKHPLLPPPTLNVGVIEGGVAGSTVPDECVFKLCLHYLPGVMSYESVVNEVKSTLLLRAQGDEWLIKNPPEISIYQTGGAFEMDTDEEFVKVAKETMESVTNRAVRIKGATSGNDARLLKNIGNMPTVVLGPGSLEQCHSPNEYILLDEYYRFILIYANLILNWAKSN